MSDPNTNSSEYSTGSDVPLVVSLDQLADIPRFGVYRLAFQGGGERFCVRGKNERGIGDTVHPSFEDAEKQSLLEQRQYADRQARLAEQEAAAQREQAEREAELADDYDGFLADMSPMQKGLAKKRLSKVLRFSGEVMSRKEMIDRAAESGALETNTQEVPRVAPMSKRRINRADNREHMEHEKRMKEAGTKTIYTVNGYEIPKIAYEYAQFLLKNKIKGA
ncbi:hypothetical protein [Thioalkalivibrio sp. ALE23]|uniref:hypothetical protein n=1 Tax=Thioalkalivibrio sp. ALE23 TaxID=1265495 RepID=UPI0003730EB8|nr:hypothetical protein [Thioalkalivibrio sp. ALE23]